MKIKLPIYFAAALTGVLALFLGPELIGKELGLAAGFALLMFGLYGLSRSSGGSSSQNENGPDEQ
ncbi:MAG TPA: hypothetical protein VLL47_09915 [Robiginitalea sp.]|nr:hypothetical protein [Robiginitalea sp.]